MGSAASVVGSNVTIVLAVSALGFGIGIAEFMKEMKSVEARDWGRAIKLPTTISTTLVTLFTSALTAGNPRALWAWATVWVYRYGRYPGHHHPCK
jgi:hypothetical protein